MSAGTLVTGSMEYLRRPLARNVRPGDRALVLTDTTHDPRVWQVVMSILQEIGADVTVALFERRPADYYDPPAAVCDAMMKSDVNVLLASTGMLHSPASFRAMEARIPSICMDGGMTLEMFQSGAVTDDMKQIMVRKHYVAKDIFGAEASECRVTSRYGTDFTYRVDERIFVPPLPGDDFDPYKIVDFRPGDVVQYEVNELYREPDGVPVRAAGDRRERWTSTEGATPVLAARCTMTSGPSTRYEFTAIPITTPARRRCCGASTSRSWPPPASTR
jgi:hypothetical protein